MKSVTKGDAELIRDFNRNGDLLKWIYNNGAMKLSVVMYLIVDSMTSAILSPRRTFEYE